MTGGERLLNMEDVEEIKEAWMQLLTSFVITRLKDKDEFFVCVEKVIGFHWVSEGINRHWERKEPWWTR